jgi:hypothetical protein
MDNPEYLPGPEDDVIVIKGRSDTDYWCQRFGISPFTLCHLLKTVGNRASQIVDFLHKHQGEALDNIREPVKNVSIL